MKGNQASAFVGTTRDEGANWVTDYRYEVDAPGALTATHIKGAWEMDLRDGTKGEWIPNPYYEPHTPKQPVAPASEAPPASQLPEGWTR
ncbi:hypothetical protein K2224_38975 (plasmid) [Streptomyces sp. BHT-5-2]|uniref:hypothetical protein n=1 Tax=Streptomyces sp. BHT-5-2 TaxID=2866715 RepID=UPI001C8DEEBA|nr:hypothetical protein [Streptomyces sp. BHT-5-2]QZL08971.1 hypothetical protein K2224_38975 [Streptomyces sp. BHT-5-2]